MRVIYEPRGKAREYAERALNIYLGCTHGCRYCYAPGASRKSREVFFAAAAPRDYLITRLIEDCEQIRASAMPCPEILISFIGDPYQPAELDRKRTREVILVLMEYDLSFTILTKGGLRAARDFELVKDYPRFRFGTSLSFFDEEKRLAWEPQAASVAERIAAIGMAKSMGIPTWVSLEPVIDPQEAFRVISEISHLVDHWKIGKANYLPEIEKTIDWMAFRDDAAELLDAVGADYYLKKSLTEL